MIVQAGDGNSQPVSRFSPQNKRKNAAKAACIGDVYVFEGTLRAGPIPRLYVLTLQFKQIGNPVIGNFRGGDSAGIERGGVGCRS
jgi:hypothetical protein